MGIPQGNGPTPGKPLRVWPGLVAVALLGLARFGLKAVVPGFEGFAWGAQGGFVGAGAVLLWWVFFSRAAWAERLGAVALMAAGLGGAWSLRHESMGPFWLFLYAIPILCFAFVAWAVAARRLADGPRRATMVAAILLACGGWTLVRTEGITGDHVATFAWRFAKSPEERLLAQAGEVARARASAPTPAGTPPASVPPVGPDVPKAASPAPVARTTGAETSADAGAEWPGFRGPRRDGVVPGVTIETDWAKTPPVELWRRPVGPGWSSFAVRGNLLYTQEQRGEDEVVACYRVDTGEPVWTHRDATRFFESNAGAGPRATPAVGQGRAYSFGATGILNALDARDGTVRWSRNLASENGLKVPTWGFSGSPLVVGDEVFVAAAGQLLAFDSATGGPRWAGAPGDGYSSPHPATLDGVAQVLLMSNSGITGVAPHDGTVLWEHRWGGFPMVQPELTAGGAVLVAASSGSGTRALAVAHGAGGWTVAERWTSLALKPYFNHFVVHEGHAFGFDGRILACVGLEDGARRWKGGRYGNGQLLLLPDQDLLLVLSEEGELALVGANPDRFTELARFPAIRGKTWNHPVLVGDVLLLRNGEEMAAYRLSLAGRRP